MDPERWRQIEALYQAARERSPKDRALLLSGISPDLRTDVEALLASEAPAADPSLLLTKTMSAPVSAGTVLGPYRIEAPLGQGGMGQVFSAIDTRLGRRVAIKVSFERFNDRFGREAKAISSLNHPHICTLYDVGPNYLVMELVDGETLATRLKSGRLSIEQTIQYAQQIASALAAAHAKGIIHRDLKPGNIMLSSSGVKVLDFGLAKTADDETLTASHAVMGTPAYMAPEQREGKVADSRTDIYAFGCVLYEMSSGVRIGPERDALPGRLEKIVARCLERDAARRWQSVTEIEHSLRVLNRSAFPWRTVAVGALAALAVLVTGYSYFHRAPKLTDKDTIVLADFDNKTSDPVFDDALRQGLSVELQQSPFLSMISDQKVQATLALMGQPNDARLTPKIARQVCERTGSVAVLDGSIASLGSQYVLGLRATSCTTGKILDEEQAQTARREDVLNSLSQIARKFRARVGESLATVQEHSVPLVEATTSSLEALKAYSRGLMLTRTSGDAQGIPLLKRATEIDPEFAEAHAVLGLSYAFVGEWARARESTTKAWQLRDRVSDQEKFYITFSYDRQVTGNLEKAFQTLELWIQTYPRGGDPNPKDFIAGLAASGTGRWERAIEQGQESIAEYPDFAYTYSNLVTSYFFVDRFDDAEKALQQASVRKVEEPTHLAFRYDIAFLKGDKEQMDQVATLAKGKRRAEYWLANSEALVQARSGHLQQARQLSSRAIDLAQREGDQEMAATYQAVEAAWEALFGNTAEARRDAAVALSLSNGRDVEYAAGLALAFSGEMTHSDVIANDLQTRFPEDTFVKFTYVPVLRAVSAISRNRPAQGLEQLAASLPYELAANGLSFNLYLGGLHSAYVRGEAFNAAHRYAEAMAEFQKILDHRGVVAADPIGALAHLQLGRTLSLSGDKVKAKSAYLEFLGLWKDADSDIPILRQAKAEYARLQ